MNQSKMPGEEASGCVIERTGNSTTITISSSGRHLGRNGYAKIVGLQIELHHQGTVSFDSINSTGSLTVGGMRHVPARTLLQLLEHLKKEWERFEPDPPAAVNRLLNVCRERGIVCEDLDEAVLDAAGLRAADCLNQTMAAGSESILEAHGQDASRANNAGLPGQLRFLMQAIGEAATRAVLDGIVGTRPAQVTAKNFQAQAAVALESARRARIEGAFEAHTFPETVVAAAAWEYDGENHFKRVVFLRSTDGPSCPVVFHVEFLPDSAEIETAEVAVSAC